MRASCDGCASRSSARSSPRSVPPLPGDGQSIATPCTDCRGEGRRTEQRTLTVDIPAGVDDGSTLRLAGHGPAGFRGGPNGALFVHLAVRPDDVFERAGVDLHATLHVPMTLAALGGSLPFDTLDDQRDLPVPAGTQSGTVVPLRGLGVPKLRGRGRGDLYVHLQVDTPTDLDDAQRELLVRLAEHRAEELGDAPRRGLPVQAALGPELTVAAGGDGAPGPNPAPGRVPTAPDPVLVGAAAMVFVADPAAPHADDADVRHLLDVLRLRAGESVVVSDGAGRWAPCRVAPVATGRGSRDWTARRCWSPTDRWSPCPGWCPR